MFLIPKSSRKLNATKEGICACVVCVCRGSTGEAEVWAGDLPCQAAAAGGRKE